MTTPSFDTADRYHRQMLLPHIGAAGQDRLGSTRGLLVGCGALGTVIADVLVRAGIGALTIVDRDLVELTNLQRQVLFDENDVARGLPKAEAARRRLAAINRQVRVDAHVEDFNHRNAKALLGDADVILDGLDNFETRFLLNDLAVAHGRPYLYGGAVGTTGVSLAVLPAPTHRRRPPGAVTWSADDATPCLRCVFPEAPPPGASPTCDTAGVLGPVVMTIAAHQAAQALKLLTGNVDAVDRALLSIDAWTNTTRRFDVARARGAAAPGPCPCCGDGAFTHLEGTDVSRTTSLCGSNAVQITPAGAAGRLDLEATAARLAPHGRFTHNDHLVRGVLATEHGAEGAAIELTLFPDGRAIIKGTTEPEAARSIYARYVGA